MRSFPARAATPATLDDRPLSQAVAEALTEALTEDGVAVVEGLLPLDQIHRLQDLIEQHREAGVAMSGEVLYTHVAPPPATPSEASPGEPRGMRRLMDQWLNPHRRPAPLSTWPILTALRPLIEGWLGGPAVLFQDVLMTKHAGHEPFPWHQDYPFWPVDVPAGLVLWVPLDPVQATTGGLHLAIGSHRAGIGPAVDLHTGAPQPGTEGELLDPSPYEIVCPVLAPGDAVVFHPLTWHASPRNRSGKDRRVWASTWLDASARWSVARTPRHPLCRFVEDGAPVSERPGMAR